MKNLDVYDRFRAGLKGNTALLKNISGTIILKGLSISIGFLSTPTYIAFFSNQAALGIWFTILSIINWILTFDLGIGNGLRNNLVGPLLKRDYIQIKKQISSAYIMLGVISFISLVIGWFWIDLVNWNNILNVRSGILSQDILVKTIRVVFVGIGVQFWLKTVISILNAMQKNVLANLLGLITNVCILIFILVGKTGNLNIDIVNLAYVNFVAVNLPLVIVTLLLFTTTLKQTKPSIKFYDKSIALNIVSLGGKFFIIQLGLLVVNSTNQLLISSLYTSDAVVDYQIYYKFFSIATMIFSLFTQPIWSATSNAYVRGDIKWIKKIYSFLNVVALIGSLCCFGIIPISQYLFDVWLGKNILIISTSTALIFATEACLEMFMYSSTCIANGIGKLKCQFVCTLIAAVLKIPTTIFLSNRLNMWESVVLAHMLVILLTVVFQPIVLRKQLIIKKGDKILTEAI